MTNDTAGQAAEDHLRLDQDAAAAGRASAATTGCLTIATWLARWPVSALLCETMFAHASMTPAAHARLTDLLLTIATLVAVVLGVYGSQAW